MQKSIHVSLLFLMTLLISACEPSSRSNAISNSEFWITNSITVDPDTHKVSCFTSLSVGGAGGTNIDLDSEDTLTCSLASTTQSMTRSSAGAYSYSEMTATVGGSYSLTLTRGGSSECGKSGTFTGQVVLPEAMVITSPTAAAIVSRATSLAINWTPGTADSVAISLSGTTVGTFTTSTTDIGNYTISATDMADLQNGPAKLTLTRTNIGQHPSGIKGGSTTATQYQEISLTVAD